MKIHNYVIVCKEKEVKVNVFQMDRSCYVWLGLGAQEPGMSGGLATAIQTKYEDFPICKCLVFPEGEEMDEHRGPGIAKRIAKRLGIQAFVSCNLPASFEEEQLELERQLQRTLQGLFDTEIS